MARPEDWALTLLVVIVFIFRWPKRRSPHSVSHQGHPKPTPWPLKPRTPDDCPACRVTHQPHLLRGSTTLKPYSQTKSPRGRKKRIATAGYACPNSGCRYYGITNTCTAPHAVRCKCDQTLRDALVGYGGHPVVCHLPQRLWALGCTGNRRASGGRQEYIRDLKCQACQTTPAPACAPPSRRLGHGVAGGAREFSVRYGTVLYRLKTPARRVGEVLSALAEGLSVGAAVRVFGPGEFTIRTRFA